MPTPFAFASCGFAMAPIGYTSCIGTPDCAASRCTVPAGCAGQAVMCFGESFAYFLASPLTIGQSYTISISVSTGHLGASTLIGGNHTFNVIGLTGPPPNCAGGYGGTCSTPGATLLLSGTVNTIGWQTFSNTFVAASALQHIMIGNCDGTGNGGNIFCNVNLQTATVFPIELTDFSAEANECSVVLDWETGSSTTAMDKFELIRSVEGRTDVVVATLPAANGAQRYQATDHSPALSATYQLRMLDLNGSESRSKVLSIDTDCHGAGLSFASNPISTDFAELVYQSQGKALKVSIHNTEGRLVHQETIPEESPGWHTHKLDVSKLQPGIYLASTSDGEVVKMMLMR